MSAHILDSSQRVKQHETTSFARVGAVSAMVAGVGGLLYAVAFVIISRSNPALGGLLSAALLTANGLLTTLALAALYGRVRAGNETAALWALLVGSVAALGAAMHGGYDLANAINPPAIVNFDLPSPVDPRGLLTFGVAGIATLVFSLLIGRDVHLPKGLVYLGYLLGILLIVIYLARLIVLTPSHPFLLIPVLLSGFLVNPAWYLWLGAALWRTREE